MTDPKNKPDVPPTPERDTSRKGREEEVINQQEGNNITNTEDSKIINNTVDSRNAGEKQFEQGTFDHTVKLDEVDEQIVNGSDRTGGDASEMPGSAI